MSFITVIPAAGAGTRMRPLTNTLPKAMVTVAGRPILNHIVEKAAAAGCKEFAVIVEYLSDAITQNLPADFPDFKFTFIHQGPMQGLGHAVFQAKDACEGRPVLIIYGDTLFEADLSEVVKSKQPLFGISEVEDPRRFGIIEVDENDRITRFIEKPENPSTNLTLPGVNFFPDATGLFSALAYLLDNEIKIRGEYQVTDAYEKMVQDGARMGYFKLDAWYDCGKHAETLQTNEAILKKEGSQVKGKLIDCTIVDPVYIGEGSELTNCTIGPYVAIGRDNRLKDCTLKSSVIANSNEIKNCSLEEVMIGSGCRLADFHSKAAVLGDHSLINARQD